MIKMNKKGFTLIEMLVVIAIIAILVSIIIPAVSSSTKRAAAATDAANLRSAKAVIAIKQLDGTYPGAESSIPARDCGVPEYGKYDKTAQFAGSIDDKGNITVTYGNNTIDTLADFADNGKIDNNNEQGGQQGGEQGGQQQGGQQGGESSKCGCTNYEGTSFVDSTCKNCGHSRHFNRDGGCTATK